MSSLYDTSVVFQQNIRHAIKSTVDEKLRKYLERQQDSCYLICCQVGNLYHMEAKAKLTLLQNIVNGVVFMLVNVDRNRN